MLTETDIETLPRRIRFPHWKHETTLLDPVMGPFLKLNPECKAILVQYDGPREDAPEEDWPQYMYSVYLAGKCVRVIRKRREDHDGAVGSVLDEQREWRDAVEATKWPVIIMAE